MNINPELVKEAIRFSGIVLLVIINNHVKEELGINQPRKTPEPGMLKESLKKQGIIPERKCIYTLIYDGRLPEPCPHNDRFFYPGYQQWKKENGL